MKPRPARDGDGERARDQARQAQQIHPASDAAKEFGAGTRSVLPRFPESLLLVAPATAANFRAQIHCS